MPVIIAQFQFLPDQGSDLAREVDQLFWAMVGITGTVLFAIALVIIFFLAKYRRSNPHADRTLGNRSTLPAETTWTVIPMFIFIGMFAWGANLYFRKSQVPRDAIEVEVIGKQWMWKIQHPEGKKEINQLHVPLGKSIKLIMTSQDVIHDFGLPSFRVKQDVLPGRYTTEWFTPTKTGVFPIFCNQYCGTDHANMIGQVYVLEPQAYAAWLRDGMNPTPIAEAGANLYRSLGCSGCHEANGVVRAPSLHGLYGQPVPLQDRRIVIADERYLRDSILMPDYEIVASYDPVMPSYAGRLSEDQIYQLIAYIKSLGGEQPQTTSGP
ncbi:MAG: cytochrome c oxidase subunit II [Verrucomicrobia bacterium]|nr:cytochrome c oxidase subunit II [Verrucomicrobiota bacterium]